MMEVLLRVSFAVYFISIGICTDMPRFAYKAKDCELFIHSYMGEWHAGCPNSAAVLNRHELRLHINTEGDIISQLMSILITCPGSRSPTKLRLLKNSTTTTTFCKTENFPVELRYDASSHHFYELVPGKFDIDVKNIFSHHLVISINVEAVTSSGKTIILKSNILHVYTIRSTTELGYQNGMDILTSEGLDFLNYAPYPSTQMFPRIQFLNKDFVASLQSAVSGTFFEPLLEFGAIRDYASIDCDSRDSGEALLVVNRMNFKYNIADEIYYHLNISDGTLLFSRSGISKDIVQKDKAGRKEFTNGGSSVCTYIRLGDLAKQRAYIEEYRAFISEKYNHNNYNRFSRDATCVKESSANIEYLTLFADISSRYGLKCPIVCGLAFKLKFKHGSKTLLPTPLRIHNGKLKVNRNSINLPKRLKPSDSGIYTCSYRDSSVDLQYTFNVSIVSLPAFQTKGNPKQDGSLPPVIYAVEDESLSYSCRVFYYGLPVTLAPEIFYSSSSHGWTGPLSQSDYNSYLLAPGLTESTVKDDRRIGASTLTVKVKEVPSMNRSTMSNFTHRFHCKASVPETDKHLRILNMKDYTVVSGSNVFYIPKPTSSHIIASPNNKCSTEGCNSATGVYVSFKFSSDFAAFIRKIGVKVTGYFMLDDLNVAWLPVIRPEFSTLNEAEDFELKMTIPTITEDLLYELRKRKTLTAVYNFNYNEFHTGLLLEKSKYGKARIEDDEDCRSDKLKTSCFYSTSFPAFVNDSSLNFLTTNIYF